MTATLLAKFRNWQAIENDPALDTEALALVLYLADKIYNDYEPSGLKPFMLRLDKWLNNVSAEEDQKTMLSLLAHVFFAGQGEFESLYRTSLTNIYRWLIDKSGLDICDPDLRVNLPGQLAQTWLCPVTDSLRINSFLKINEVVGHDHRPHWRSLAKFGDVKKIDAYMRSEGITRLVLLEDFIGSGSQVEATVQFAVSNFPDLEIAICPLIICPAGDRVLSSIASAHNKVTYLPTLVLPREIFLLPDAQPDEPRAYTRGRDLINRNLGRFARNAFGYKETGALIVMFTNCPDNTIPLFRHEANNWNPLFPRVWRPE